MCQNVSIMAQCDEQICSEVLIPICGRNDEGTRKSFKNECEFSNAQCREPDSCKCFNSLLINDIDL